MVASDSLRGTEQASPNDESVPVRTAIISVSGRRRRWSVELPGSTGLLMSAPFILAAVVLLVLPFVQLVISATAPPAGVGNLLNYFREPTYLRVLGVTFADSALVTVLSVGLGALLAWSLHTSRRAFVKWLTLGAIFIPFWMGSVMKLYAFSILLGREGVVNRVLIALNVVDQPLHLLYTQPAVVIGMVYQMLPYAVLPAYVAFLSIDLDMVRAAEGLGASRIRAMGSVVVPLSLPGLLAAVIIVFVTSIGFFLTPVLLGGANSPFSSSLIYNSIFSYYNVIDASVSGLWLLVAGLVVIGVGLAVVGRRRLTRALIG